MKVSTLFALAAGASVFAGAASTLKAGDDLSPGYRNDRQVIVYDANISKNWSGSVTTGLDSLYMHNGRNMLGDSGNSGWTLKQK